MNLAAVAATPASPPVRPAAASAAEAFVLDAETDATPVEAAAQQAAKQPAHADRTPSAEPAEPAEPAEAEAVAVDGLLAQLGARGGVRKAEFDLPAQAPGDVEPSAMKLVGEQAVSLEGTARQAWAAGPQSAASWRPAPSPDARQQPVLDAESMGLAESPAGDAAASAGAGDSTGVAFPTPIEALQVAETVIDPVHAPAPPSQEDAGASTQPVIAEALRKLPAVHDARWPAAMGEQIRALVDQGQLRAELQLHPAELGHVSVRIELDGHDTRVFLVSANPDARAALESALPRLQSLLDSGGLNLAQADVSQDRHPSQRGRDPLRGRSEPIEGDATAQISARVRVGVLDEYA